MITTYKKLYFNSQKTLHQESPSFSIGQQLEKDLEKGLDLSPPRNTGVKAPEPNSFEWDECPEEWSYSDESVTIPLLYEDDFYEPAD